MQNAIRHTTCGQKKITPTCAAGKKVESSHDTTEAKKMGSATDAKRKWGRVCRAHNTEVTQQSGKKKIK